MMDARQLVRRKYAVLVATVMAGLLPGMELPVKQDVETVSSEGQKHATMVT